MAAVGRGGRASRSGTSSRAAKATTVTKVPAAKAARPTKRATTKASATPARAKASKTAAKSSTTSRKASKAAAATTAKATAATSSKKAAVAPAKPAKSAVKAATPSTRTRTAAATRNAPTKKTAPRKASPNKRAARATSATATKRAPKPPNRSPESAPVAIAVPRDSEWTARELAQVRAQLLGQLSEMQSEYDQSLLDLDELQSSSTDGAGDDQADAGSKTFEREQELSIAANRLDLLTQIKRAVERIDAGTYGYCESCGKPIPKARLKAFPMATLDVACKQREERR
jgi:RNA polymerase-binding protein DksA